MLLSFFSAIFLLFQLPTNESTLSGISVVKYNVSYSYLATRTPIYTQNSKTQFNLNNVIIKNCGKQMCFAAFYDKRQKFQLISDVPNNCTKSPNCLSFTSANYDYSIVFMNTTRNECSRNVTSLLNQKFKMPKCPSGWYSWTRPNGKLWCYMISKSPHSTSQTWNSTDTYCRKTYNASLNGFQTAEERVSFIKNIKSVSLSSGWMYIGAVKPCNIKICPKTVKFVWQNGVSSNHTLANDNFYIPWFDGTGNCLSIMTSNGQYDDISCTQQTTFSCGKWADIYT